MASLLTEDVSVTEFFNSSCDEEDFEGFDEDKVVRLNEKGLPKTQLAEAKLDIGQHVSFPRDPLMVLK